MKALLTVLALLLCASLFAVLPEAPAQGNGTVGNPYHISSFNNLYWITLTPGVWNQFFIQTADIDASESSEITDANPNTAGWIPIGATSPFFTGSYDGQGYKIFNLTLHRTAINYTGLFGYMNGGSLNRVNLRDASISGGQYTGGLAGVANSNSVVNNCSVTGSVSGSVNVGGVLGYCDGSSVTNSYSHANVYASSGQGGGFVGLSGWNNASNYNYCFSTGTVAPSAASYISGFMGRSGSNTARDCFWDTQSSGIASDPVASGKSTDQMKSQSTYYRWNFHHQWSIQEGISYPNHDGLLAYSLPATLTTADLLGSGTELDPYVLFNADQLNVIRQAPNAHFILWDDIALEASVAWNYGRGWEPIGTSITPFTGRLDGNGHTISGLTISSPQGNYKGLFGFTDGADIRKLNLINCHLLGKSYVGALAGYARYGSIDEINLHGTIQAYSASGGIAGVVDSGSLQRCWADVEIKNFSEYAGGIVGYLISTGSISGSVSNSGSTGTLDGIYNVGGLVGMLSWGYILNSYSHTQVNGTHFVGGLVGTVGWSNPGYIARCYSTGLVSLNSEGSSAGGLIGRFMYGSLQESYWDTQSSSMSTSSGLGATGLSTAQMQQQESFARWIFNSLWQFEGRGYPSHRDLSGYALPQPVNISELLGSGTEEDPYLIFNTSQLNAIRQARDAHFSLEEDLDLAATCVWNGGLGWEPIGTGSAPFTGSFDGADRLLENLFLMRPDWDNCGLFGYTSGAEITNIVFTGLNMLSKSNLGSVAGFAENTSIDVIISEGSLSGQDYVGGVAGFMSSSSIQRSRTNLALWAQASNAGLIAGYMDSSDSYNSTINACETTGTIRGYSNVGGLVGHLAWGALLNSAAHASVQGYSQIGGAVGTCGWGNPGAIVRSFSTGQIITEAGGYEAGGFVGRRQSSQLYDCFWDAQSSGISTGGNDNCIPLSTSAMMQQASYKNWNFDTLWDASEGTDYPRLYDLASYSHPEPIETVSFLGSGTIEDPYLIESPDQLNAIRQNLGAHYRIVNHLDLTATQIWNGGRGWQPLGNYATPFTGSIDGNGKTIHGIKIDYPLTSYAGFIGVAEGATITNLTLMACSLVAEEYAGALAGILNYCNINRVNTVVALTAGSYAGGLAGLLTGGSVSECSATASINARNYCIGGLLGYVQDNALISLCSASGRVLGNSLVGGFVGNLVHGTVSDSYSHTAVQGSQYLGGFTGSIGWGEAGQLHHCYSTGAVSINPDGSYGGGLVGQLYYGTVTGCYWDINTSGMSSSAGGTGAIGLTTAQMTWPDSQNQFSGWDFASTWAHDSSSQNSGYPLLVWQEIPVPEAVQNLSISRSGDQFLLEWDSVAEAGYYEIYASEDPYAPWEDWSYIGQSNSPVFLTTGSQRKFFMVRAVGE